MAFNLSGSAAIVPVEGLSALMARAPEFNKSPFMDNLARQQAIKAGLMDTAMKGGAEVRGAKILADANVEIAKINNDQGPGQGLMAAGAALLGGGGLGGGGRAAGEALGFSVEDMDRFILGRFNLIQQADQYSNYFNRGNSAMAASILNG